MSVVVLQIKRGKPANKVELNEMDLLARPRW